MSEIDLEIYKWLLSYGLGAHQRSPFARLTLALNSELWAAPLAARAGNAQKVEELDKPNHPAATMYAIQLWDAEGTVIEQVIGRASSKAMADALLSTAERQYPGRRITVVEESLE